MKKVYFLLLTSLVLSTVVTAQVNNYIFAGSTGTFTSLVGGTTSTAPTNTTPDDGIQTSIPIGFTFAYNGTTFTQFGISCNGTIELGSGVATSFTNALASNANVIAPLWDDNNMTGGSISYLTTGGAGNHILTVEWTNMHVGGSGSTTNPTITMQVLLYEATGAVQFVYGSTSGALSGTTASIGISGAVGNYLSVTPLSPPNTSTVSSSTENVSISSATNFPSGTIYTFTPPPPCAGTPTAGTTAASLTSVCSGSTTVLSLTGSTTGVSGLTYQWQSSPDNIAPYVNIAGATNSTYTATVTANTYYRCVVTCTNGGGFQNSTPIQVTLIIAAVPTAQPTGLILTPTSTNSISGSFTAAVGAPTGYLVVRTPTNTPPSAPVNGTTYTVGSSALGGVIIGSGAATSFVSGGLTPNTTYYYWVYSFNTTACTNSVVYRSASPISGSQTTLTCSPLAAGTYTVGPTGTYTTLTAAAAAVNGGTSGAVIFELQSTYLSSAEPGFPIVFSTNACPVVSLVIRPQTGATALSVTGANATGSIIDLNGISNVTIDGRAGGVGVSQLTISNTSAASNSTIRFINDASNSTIKFCTLLGSTTGLGVVYFSTGVATGNDGNTITDNTITAAGANFPLNGIYSVGTSTVIDNSGNSIANNNFADVFSATAIFNGIFLGTGNSTWTITNNKIYQTAIRTITTANTDNGINITSGNGYTITGNMIGYASSTATGIMTLNSTVALRYIGINGSFTAGPVSSIQNNTIASIAMTTSSGATTLNGILCGMSINSGDANIGTITPNTFGATSGTGSLTATSTTSGGLLVGINSATTGTISIQNNTFGSFACSGTTAAVAGSITVINVPTIATTMNITGNTIGNTTTDNIRGGTSGLTTGSSLVSGINVPGSTASSTVLNVTNNTIQNLTSYGTGTTGFVRGFWSAGVTGSGTVFNITSNTVINLATNATLTSITSGATCVGGIIVGGGNNSLVSQNTVNGLTNTNVTATGNFVAGIVNANATNTTITQNRIYNITNAGTSVTVTTPSIAAGIIVRSGTTAVNITNNMISLGNGQTTNTAFIGIQCNHGSTPDPTNNIYFNSINIEGIVTTGAQPSFGIARTDFTATAKTAPMDVRDNLITNTRTGGTGKHYAITNNYGATATTTGWGLNASNYNILNATAATVGYWTGDQTFATWKTASNSDANSQSGVAISYTATPTADLHIASVTSPVEGAGIAIGSVTVDYDNQLRANFSPTDIGADAGNFFNYPVMNYTPLANVCTVGARTLVANITDVDGVPTSGVGLPVLYWKINAGAYTAVTATSLGGGNYQFSFGAGAVINNVVSYYIVSQDNLGNVGSSPALGAGGFTTNPPAAATPPTTPNTYSILPTLSGTYTVGVGGNFTTLTAAALAYSNSCLGGPVVFSLTDATYPSETFPINFNVNPAASAVNTLTIKPTGTTTISGSTASTIIQINGADYITIDGSNGTTVNSICPSVSASRNLTIQNTNAASFSAVVWLNTVTSPVNDGVTNCTVKNCVIIGGSNVNTAAGIGIGTLPLISGGINNNSNRIENNDIRLCRFGIYVVGQSGANKDDGNVISQNILTAASPNNIGEGGIFSVFENNLTVSGNQIDNINIASSPDSYGINLGFGITNGFSATGVGIPDALGNATITFNKIGGIINSGTFSAVGLAMSNTITGTQLIANNTISGVVANGTAGDFSAGLWLNGGTGTTNVYYNTVVMQGVQNGSAGSQTSTAFGVLASSSALTVRNNIFVNTQGGGAAGTTTRYAAVSFGYASPYTGFISSNNDLYSNGAGPGTYTTGITGGVVAGTSRLTLGDWQTETGQDANSKSVNPVFVSATDLHLVTSPAGTNWCLNNSGINIPAVTNDIDCEVRNNPPDIGADEFIATSTAAATPVSQTINCGSSITPITFSGSGTTFNWTRDNTGTVSGTIGASGTGTISGTLINPTSAPITVTFTITPADAVGCSGPSFTATVTVNPTPNAIAAPSSQTVCSGIAITPIALSSTTAGTITYAWTRDNVATVTGIAASGSGNISGTLTNTTFAAITVTFTITPTSGGCAGTPITATVLVNPTPNAIATPSAQTVCSGVAIVPIALTSSTAGTTFTWTRDNSATVTGIAASGAGTPISGTLTNTTFAPITVTFTITPTANGCPSGPPTTATVLVNPTPNAIATPSSQPICSGFAITPIVLTSSAAGTTYTWTRDNTVAVTGMAASGAGTPISGTLTNTTGAPVTVTFTITPTTNGCVGPTSTATVVVNSLPTWTAVQVQPSNCVATDGSITLTMTGPGGPYTFAWTGTGVNPTSQNQTGLTVGIYSVTVTVQATGCQSSATYTLLGPGGCFICPTIPSLTTNPSPSNCTGVNTTITASGLTNMGITYGIIFKYSNTPLADPYAGGTVISTVPNSGPGGLTNGGTVATANTIFNTAGTYYIYAILTPTPVDPACRPSNVVVLTVNNTPTLTLGASPTVCSGSTTAPLPFSSTYTGTSGNIVVNGGFETGASAPWVVLSAQPAPVISGTVSHTGTYSYALGSLGLGETPGDASVYQTITVPAEGGTLSYWYLPTTTDGITFDWQDAYITNTSGTILTTIMHVCQSSGWTNVTFNMAAYAGQTVRVEFLVHGDNAGDPTNMYVDDVTLNGPGGAPATYSITWSAPAIAAGFTNVNNAPLPSSPTPITLVVPAAAAPATYTGTITVTTVFGCSNSTPQTFTITINPIPVVNQPANQVVCNGGTTAAVTFTTPTTGPGTIVYNWTHSASGIGLANNGTGNIPTFTAINNTNAPVIATITVTPIYTFNGVSCTGAPKSFTITINPTPTVNAVTNQAVCHNTATAAVNFSGFVPGTVFNWTNNNATIGLAGAGTGNIASFTAINAGAAPVVATITVTPSYTNAGVTCTGTAITFTITVNPIPTVNAVSNQTVCNNTLTSAVIFGGATTGTVFNWTNNNTSIGLPASGTGNIGAFTAINTGSLPVSATITVTPTFTNGGTTCTGTPTSFTITVNPSPTVNPVPGNQLLCNGSATAPVQLTGPVSGAFYTWSNNNASIGLPALGSGNIPSFTATNTGNAPVTATVTVTGNFTSGGVTCTGPAITFTITVNPTPSVNAIANQTLCNGATSTAVTISGPVGGTVFNWTNNNTSIGLAASGTGNIGTFVAINNTGAPAVATVTVTPTFTANGLSCTGTPVTFTITVNPTTSVNGVANQLVCNGTPTAAVTFSGPVAGTVFNWTNNTPSIGLAASGTGNIASFTAINAGIAPVTATITVTTTGAGCAGGSTSFTITVNPTPSVNQPANLTVCNGSATAAVTFTGSIAGATVVYNWTNNNTTIGLGASGAGNIPSFTAINPTASAVVATITVTPTYTSGGLSCTGTSKSFTITVNPGATIVFTNAPVRVCLTDTVVVLTATPAGGVWAGRGITGNTFSATAAGLGVSTVSYTVASGSGCSATSLVNITVNDCLERHNVLAGAIRIYPNPSSGLFNIKWLTDVYKSVNFNVIDANGAILKTYSFNNLVFGSVIPMDLRTLPSGVYMLEVFNSQEKAFNKFVIAR